MHYFFSPMIPGIELVYSTIIVALCFMVYFKTKEIYELTKHKGIQFFRYAFLFFGLAYASRLFLHLLIVGSITFDVMMSRRAIMPLSNLAVGYFSTMAILYLTYSTIWKKIKPEHFFLFSNIFALFVAAVAFIFISPAMLSLLQLILLVFAVFFLAVEKKTRKVSPAKLLYLLIFVFWLMNLFALSPRRFLPFEVKLVFQAVSIIVFIIIYYKVSKWTR